MFTEALEYKQDETICKGFLAYDETSPAKRPAILVAHAWKGQDAFARQKAEALAHLGYIGLAIDMYGEGRTAHTDEQALELMKPLFINRKLLRKRVLAAFDAIKTHSLVDHQAIGAIGFCFGGLTVIELLKSGAPVKSVASFHGVLGSVLGDMQARVEPLSKDIKGSILLLHGNDDPLVSQEDIRSLQKELSQAGIDWEMNIYGHAAHAFTNPGAQDPVHGMVFEPKANKRSWLAMRNFFDEIFNKKKNSL
jgi:dienelactone hydrolase